MVGGVGGWLSEQLGKETSRARPRPALGSPMWVIRAQARAPAVAGATCPSRASGKAPSYHMIWLQFTGDIKDPSLCYQEAVARTRSVKNSL